MNNTIPPITKGLLLLNIGLFAFVNLLSPQYISKEFVDKLMGWHPSSPFFEPYQVITSMFMHANFGHLFFNMFALWMFGSPIENYLKEKRFLILYFAAGFGAYALHFAIQSNPYIPVVGASGAIYGILVAFAVLYPNVPLMLIFLPIPIKAKYFILLMVGYDLIFGIGNVRNEMMQKESIDNVGHFAHLGGAVIGFVLMKFWLRNRFLNKE